MDFYEARSLNNDLPFTFPSLEVSLIIFLGLAYSLLSALSLLQSFYTSEVGSPRSLLETNGTKIRPYFLSVFACGLILRLIYIIIYLVVSLEPKLVSCQSVGSLNIFKGFDYLIHTVFLISYSIVIVLWSSVFANFEDSNKNTSFSAIMVLKTFIYSTVILFIASLIVYPGFPGLQSLYILLGALYLGSSYFWVYFGIHLIDQISKRQHAAKKTCRFFQSCGTNSLEFRIPYIGKGQSGASDATTVSSANFHDSDFTTLLIYNRTYSSSVNKLKFKIKLLTLICPISLLLSGAFNLLRGFGISGFFHSNHGLTAAYLIIVEITPSVTLLYGFWDKRVVLFSALVRNQVGATFMQSVSEDFRSYTRIC
ncbi:putative integral membrane protein [Cryptosporidium felis]|nr:putative integral membrane protein [Cryptosporidium felis]